MHPINIENTVVRTDLLPLLLEFLNLNRHRELPQRLFTVGDVVDSCLTYQQAAGVSTHPEADFSEAYASADAVLHELSVDYTAKDSADPAFIEGRQADIVARLRDAGQRAKIKRAIVESLQYDRGGGDPKNVQIAACGWDPSPGKNLAEITRARGAEPTLDHAAEAVMWIVEQGGASGIFHAIDEADLERILKDPVTMIASDGEVPIFGKASCGVTHCTAARRSGARTQGYQQHGGAQPGRARPDGSCTSGPPPLSIGQSINTADQGVNARTIFMMHLFGLARLVERIGLTKVVGALIIILGFYLTRFGHRWFGK